MHTRPYQLGSSSVLLLALRARCWIAHSQSRSCRPRRPRSSPRCAKSGGDPVWILQTLIAPTPPFAGRVRLVVERRSGSAECEHKRLHARIEKHDLELPISDRLRLSDQLIQPLFGNRAVALVVNVNSVSSAGRLSIDEHAKSYGSSSHGRPHDEMKIAGVKAVRDPSVGLVQDNGWVL